MGLISNFTVTVHWYKLISQLINAIAFIRYSFNNVNITKKQFVLNIDAVILKLKNIFQQHELLYSTEAIPVLL